MNLLGWDIQRSRTQVIALGLQDTPIDQKAVVTANTFPDGIFSSQGRGWWPIIRESFAGAWQRNIEIRPETALTFAAVFRCIQLISSDIGKLRIKLVRKGSDGIWREVESNSPFWPVLRKPNHFQIRIAFFEQWMTSKLIQGNTYVLKQRDNRGGENRGVPTAMYVLDPHRVRPLVAPNGDVYYALQQDDLSRVESARAVVPASEIIHDTMFAPFHPLCGISPLTACGLAALHGLNVQNFASKFFENGANPGGVLTAPGTISTETAKRLEDNWNTNYGGANAGKVAVLGDGLKYERMTMTAVDAQLIEQLRMTGEQVCTAFGVPAFKVGIGPTPPHNNVQALQQMYYEQTLQSPIEKIELLLDDGMGLDDQSPEMGTEFELDDLMRMDTLSRMQAAEHAMKSGASPNEVRFRFHDYGPVVGGDSPMIQQQNFSLEALSKRDARPDPFAKTPARQLPASSESSESSKAAELARVLRKGLSEMQRRQVAADHGV